MIDDPLFDIYIQTVKGKKAQNIVVLDISKLTSIADAFIICSGSSSRQVTAIAEHIEMELKKNGIMPISKEGIKEGRWALLDYGHVIIHVFQEPVREFYDLDGLWRDAKIFRIESDDMTPDQEDIEDEDEDIEVFNAD